MKYDHVTHHDAILGRLIVSERENRNLGQHELAKAMKINQPTLSRIESGDSPITPSGLVALTAALEISLPDFARQFERAIQIVEREHVKVMPKKQASSEANGNTLMAFIGGAALALLLSRS